jgi:hypothetical protein
VLGSSEEPPKGHANQYYALNVLSVKAPGVDALTVFVPAIRPAIFGLLMKILFKLRIPPQIA